ncbi:MAG: UshA-like (seleno)protein [Desulfurivibrionaceae bacterium]|nr:UshA-like (seleno)protein [Desulfurivibrionaceae bacterium]
MGGLSKKATLLQELAPSATALKIDAGTLFFDDAFTGQPERLAQALITAGAIVEAYNHMGYDAVALGHHDLAAGKAALKSLAAKAEFPFVSANLADMEGSLLFEPVAHVERAGMRITLIGLTGGAQSDPFAGWAKILPWQEVLPPLLARHSAASDLIILLSSLPPSDNRAIAAKMADVHLIIQSGSSKQNMRPQLINNTLISQVGHDGKYQGQLTVEWPASRRWQAKERPILALQKEYDRLGWMLDKIAKKGGAEVVYKENKAARQAFLEKEERHRQLAAEIAKLATADKKEHLPVATYTNHFHPLHPSLADDVTISRLLQQARKKANQVQRAGAGPNRDSQYMGSRACGSCHEAIYQAWGQTPHATAYQTLVAQEQNHNPNCVYCHVTGLAEENAHLGGALPESLKEVGCESCHGPGRNHLAAAGLAPLPLKPAPSLCTSCHNAERDDNFNYQQDKGKVHGP